MYYIYKYIYIFPTQGVSYSRVLFFILWTVHITTGSRVLQRSFKRTSVWSGQRQGRHSLLRHAPQLLRNVRISRVAISRFSLLYTCSAEEDDGGYIGVADLKSKPHPGWVRGQTFSCNRKASCFPPSIVVAFASWRKKPYGGMKYARLGMRIHLISVGTPVCVKSDSRGGGLGISVGRVLDSTNFENRKRKKNNSPCLLPFSQPWMLTRQVLVRTPRWPLGVQPDARQRPVSTEGVEMLPLVYRLSRLW